MTTTKSQPPSEHAKTITAAILSLHQALHEGIGASSILTTFAINRLTDAIDEALASRAPAVPAENMMRQAAAVGEEPPCDDDEPSFGHPVATLADLHREQRLRATLEAAAREALVAANPNNEPWRCPAFARLALLVKMTAYTDNNSDNTDGDQSPAAATATNLTARERGELETLRQAAADGDCMHCAAARHEAREAERTAIIVWLRELDHAFGGFIGAAYHNVANAIERDDHLRKTSP